MQTYKKDKTEAVTHRRRFITLRHRSFVTLSDMSFVMLSDMRTTSGFYNLKV